MLLDQPFHDGIGSAQRGDHLRCGPDHAAARVWKGSSSAPSSVDGGSPNSHSHAIRCQFAVASELAEHAERQRLHPAGEHRLRGHRLAAHQLPVAGARVAEVDQRLGHQGAVHGQLAVLGVPGGHVVEVLEHGLGRDLLVVRIEEAHRGEPAVEAGGVAFHHGAQRLHLGVDVLARHSLRHPEVDERHAAVRHQPVVARVRVAREVAVPVERPEEEAEHDLAEAVARGAVLRLDLLEADPVDPLGDEHVLCRELGHDSRHVDERVPAPRAREGAVLLGLVLVVELVGEPLLDLGGHRLGVHARRDPLRHAHDQPQVLEVRPHRLRDARVLHLHRHVAAVVKPRPIDLADRGRGHRVLAELREHVAQPLAEVVLDDLPHLGEGDPRGGVAQLGELRLHPLLELGREGAGVDERGHLADLHRRALHLAEHVEDLLGRLHLAARRGGVPRLLAAREVRRLRGVAARGLAAGQLPDLRGSPNPAGRKVLRHRLRVRIVCRPR